MVLVKFSPEALALLEDFLYDAFHTTEFERIVRKFVEPSFLPQSSSPRDIVRSGVDELVRHGCIDRHFFLELQRYRPRRIREIDNVREQFLCVPPPSLPARGNVSSSSRDTRKMVISLSLIGGGTVIICVALLTAAQISGTVFFTCASVSSCMFGIAASDRPSFLLARSLRRSLRPPDLEEVPDDLGRPQAEAAQGESVAREEGAH